MARKKKKVDYVYKPAEKKKFSLSRRKKIVLIIIGVFLLLIILRIVTHPSKKRNEDISFIPVEVSRVKKDIIRDIVTLTARLEAISQVNAYAPVTGWIDRILVDIGDRVYKRQILATIDRNIIGSEYARAVVKAPVSGEVARIYVDKGDTVSPQVPVMQIVNYDKIKISAQVPEKYLYRVKKGDVALIKVESLPGQEFIGKVTRVSPAVDQLTGSFEIKIELPNRKRILKPGSFATINLVLDSKQALIIPRDAITGFETETPFVYKIEKEIKKIGKTTKTNYIARRTFIQSGIVEGVKVEVIKGLKEGDLVITTGKEVVKDGSKVYIQEEAE